MFDQLYLLAKGQCVYQGPTKDVIRFISKEAKITCPNYHSPVSLYCYYLYPIYLLMTHFSFNIVNIRRILVMQKIIHIHLKS